MTLRLRAFFRKIVASNGNRIPDGYYRYMETHDPSALEELKLKFQSEWDAAEYETICAKLNVNDDKLVQEGKERLKRLGVMPGGEWVLIGGPPCQAYSIVGRSRRAHDKECLDNDERQTLYKCYLSFITKLKPVVFVMENVKGLLSATHKGERLFERICSDMREAGYEIRSLVKSDPKDPRDYVVEANRFGIPQTRHRVILLGIRRDCSGASGTLTPSLPITLREALAGIPRIRSSFSKRGGYRGDLSWSQYVDHAIVRLLDESEGEALRETLIQARLKRPPQFSSESKVTNEKNRYSDWYRGRMGNSKVLTNHESRTHMASDLDRYLFCSAYAEAYGEPAHIEDFPRRLYPNHKNVQEIKPGEEIKFADRFRVQLWDRPSTTITSHIAKDGHYYIHPDPYQCRSLTVREAARLQTFPDDYLFEGNRTHQYTQVGNAVPPLLAQQIGKVVASFLDMEAGGFCDQLPPSSSGEEDPRGNFSS